MFYAPWTPKQANAVILGSYKHTSEPGCLRGLKLRKHLVVTDEG